MIVVSDTSAITSLLVIGRVDLLQQLFREVLIPPAVATELRQVHVILPGFIRETAILDIAWMMQLLDELDRGEAEAIALAKQAGADALLIDEKVGRRVARRAGLKTVGLLGVLAEAKRAGLLSEVGPVMDALTERAGFYVSTELRRQIMTLVGEA